MTLCLAFHSQPPPQPLTASNSLSVQFCCYYDPEEETGCFYSRRRRRKLIVHLSLSLAFAQFYSFQVPFHPTEWRPRTCSLVILARKVTLSICGLCQWHLSWIWRELGERGQGDSTDTTLKGKKWRSPRVSLKIVSSDCCEYCQQWWKSRHLLPCMSVMTAAQGPKPISLHASQGSPTTLAVLMAEESCRCAHFYSSYAEKQAWGLPCGGTRGKKWTECVRCGLAMDCNHPRTTAKRPATCKSYHWRLAKYTSLL